MASRGISIFGLVAGVVGGVVLLSGDASAAQCGKAAWYDLSGQTASGERASGETMTAAHRTLPFGTKVRVENLSNGKSVIVRVNDRGPFVGGRGIDVTRAGAEKLDMIRAGTAKVRVSVVDGNASLDAGCADPSPRVLTAEAVANDAARAKPPQKPTTTAAATPSPNESKPVQGSGKTLVARVQYGEGDGDAAARPIAVQREASARFSDSDGDAGDASMTLASVDIPLPRPRPPVFGDSGGAVAVATAEPVFDRALALRFLDAFAPADPAMELDVRALGYAPMPEPRGAVITE